MPRIKKKHRELKTFVGERKNLSVSAPSVPAEQFSTSVLAEQLSAIEVGANDNFHGGASPRSPRGSYATGVVSLSFPPPFWGPVSETLGSYDVSHVIKMYQALSIV